MGLFRDFAAEVLVLATIVAGCAAVVFLLWGL